MKANETKVEDFLSSNKIKGDRLLLIKIAI
jgi:hypothetical protein